MIRFYLFCISTAALTIGAYGLQRIAAREVPARHTWKAASAFAAGLGGIVVAVFWP